MGGRILPAATPAAAATIAGVLILPSTSTDVQLGPLLLVAVALAGIGVLLLIRAPIRRS